jgi:hypothetical protein
MPAKISAKQKREAVARTFGPVDPDERQYTNLLSARRHLATVPERGHRELTYVIELDELDHAIWTALDRIRERDGDRIFRESARHLRRAVDLSMQEAKPRRRSRAELRAG